jgi:SAM-dependent methyltransferase
MVYAVDNNPQHVEYMNRLVSEMKLTNIAVAGESQPGEIMIPDDAKDIDCVYLCSLWHVLYTFTHQDKANFIYKVKKCLKPNGKLVIVDNAMIHPKDDEKKQSCRTMDPTSIRTGYRTDAELWNETGRHASSDHSPAVLARFSEGGDTGLPQGCRRITIWAKALFGSIRRRR